MTSIKRIAGAAVTGSSAINGLPNWASYPYSLASPCDEVGLRIAMLPFSIDAENTCGVSRLEASALTMDVPSRPGKLKLRQHDPTAKYLQYTQCLPSGYHPYEPPVWWPRLTMARWNPSRKLPAACWYLR